MKAKEKAKLDAIARAGGYRDHADACAHLILHNTAEMVSEVECDDGTTARIFKLHKRTDVDGAIGMMTHDGMHIAVIVDHRPRHRATYVYQCHGVGFGQYTRGLDGSTYCMVSFDTADTVRALEMLGYDKIVEYNAARADTADDIAFDPIGTVPHTPGPWAVCDDNANVYAPNTDIAITNTDHINAEIDDDTRRANAHLIAAAPDMLAALRRMVHYLDDNGGREAYTWYDEIAGAVAKATTTY